MARGGQGLALTSMRCCYVLGRRDGVALTHSRRAPPTVWWARGLFYIFVGLFAAETGTECDEHASSTVMTFVLYAGYCLAAIGAMFFFMGITCCDYVKNRQLEKYQERVDNTREQRRGGADARRGGGKGGRGAKGGEGDVRRF